MKKTLNFKNESSMKRGRWFSSYTSDQFQTRISNTFVLAKARFLTTFKLFRFNLHCSKWGGASSAPAGPYLPYHNLNTRCVSTTERDFSQGDLYGNQGLILRGTHKLHIRKRSCSACALTSSHGTREHFRQNCHFVSQRQQCRARAIRSNFHSNLSTSCRYADSCTG
jgi:hypothetical protein